MRELIEKILIESKIKYAATATVSWKNKGWDTSTQLPYREVVASNQNEAERKVRDIYIKLIKKDKDIPNTGYKLNLSVVELEDA